MTTITGIITVQLSSAYGPDDLEGDAESVINRMSFMNGDMSKYGYVVVGSAEVTVTLLGKSEMIDSKVDALRKESAQIEAEACAKVTNIKRQIQQLLAITNEVKA